MKIAYTIYLVRHCDYDNPLEIMPGRLPVPLSEEGKRQAKKLCNYFSKKKIEKIYSSAVLRCKQTAEIISNKKISVEYDKRLLETFSAYQGFWKIDWPQFFSHLNELGGESNLDVQNRIVDFIKKTRFQNGKEYIICSHGDPLFFLYQYLAGEKILAQNEYDMPNTYPARGSIQQVDVKENGSYKIKKNVEL